MTLLQNQSATFLQSLKRVKMLGAFSFNLYISRTFLSEAVAVLIILAIQTFVRAKAN